MKLAFMDSFQLKCFYDSVTCGGPDSAVLIPAGNFKHANVYVELCTSSGSWDSGCFNLHIITGMSSESFICTFISPLSAMRM